MHYIVQAPSTASFKKHLLKFVKTDGADHILTLYRICCSTSVLVLQCRFLV